MIEEIKDYHNVNLPGVIEVTVMEVRCLSGRRTGCHSFTKASIFAIATMDRSNSRHHSSSIIPSYVKTSEGRHPSFIVLGHSSLIIYHQYYFDVWEALEPPYLLSGDSRVAPTSQE